MTEVHAAQVIGGAIGKSYSYIDWIIYDKEKFMSAFAQLKKQLDDKVELHYQSFGLNDRIEVVQGAPEDKKGE